MHELLLAAREGNLAKVKACLERGDDIEMQEGDSGTPLFCAVAEGHIDLVKLLLEKGAKVNTINCHGWSPIHVAAQKNRLEILLVLLKHTTVEDLISHVYSYKYKRILRPCWSNSSYKEEAWGVDKNRSHSDTAFHLATLQGHLDILKLLIDKFPGGIYLEGENRNTLLHYATQQGHLDCVNFLLEKGASLSAQNDNDETPLHIAAKNNHLGILDALLSKATPADLTVRNQYNDTTFHTAAWAGNLEALQKLLHNFPEGYLWEGAFGNKLWFTALDQNQFDIIDYLIHTYGNKILFQSSKHYGLLIQIAVHRYALESNIYIQAALQNLIKIILTKNPVLTIFIGLWKHEEIQNKLRDSQNEFARWLLTTIKNNLHAETFKIKASLSHVAVENNFEALRYLVTYIRTMNSQDRRGNTPLHYAAHDVNLFHYVRLVGSADINIKNKQSVTPLDLIKTQVENYAAQAEQYDQAFLAANLVCRLLMKVRLWQLVNQAEATFPFFTLPLDLQRMILLADENVPLSLLSDEHIQNLLEYSKQRENLNPNHSNTPNNKLQFLQRIGTTKHYGFFAQGKFIPPKDKTINAQPENSNELQGKVNLSFRH